MKLKLDNLIYTTDDEVKIEALKEKRAEEVKEVKKTTKSTDKK